MNTKQLLERLARLGESRRDEWAEAQATALQYSYSLPLRLLALTGDKAWDDSTIDHHRMMVESLYMENFRPISDVLDKAKALGEYDVMQEINAYKEVSFKTAPKSVLLSKFLEENDFPVNGNDEATTESLDNLGKKSIATDDGLCSETLAIVFAKQGKIEQAIAMYEKLAAQNPEKSSTFAARIAELRANKPE
ncbi:MAG: hypothetical protein IJR13_01935 [Bacteroidales bacterium]|nr:hypothetical protein [Bacteroidales bacterium]